MAMPLARTIAQHVTRRGGVGVLRAAPAMPWGTAAPMVAPVVAPRLTRSVITTAKYTREEAVSALTAFESEVVSANWADYLYLVYNVPFWEAEYERLFTIVQPYIHEPEVGAQFANVQEVMDVLYKCEDVRDHLNELAELVTRSSGLMGTGYAAEEKVENMDEHAKICAAEYDKLLKQHPTFKPKIEQTVGHGLAILRSKHKFNFSSMYRYFY